MQDNPRSTAIKAVAKANGLDLKVVEVEFEQPRTVEHLKASPLGKIPAFAGEDGFQLSEAIAIAIYSTCSLAVSFCVLLPLFKPFATLLSKPLP